MSLESKHAQAPDRPVGVTHSRHMLNEARIDLWLAEQNLRSDHWQCDRVQTEALIAIGKMLYVLLNERIKS